MHCVSCMQIDEYTFLNSAAVIDVSFMEPSYSVTEGESIQVCASIVSTTILPENGMVDLLISTIPNTATSNGIVYSYNSPLQQVL